MARYVCNSDCLKEIDFRDVPHGEVFEVVRSHKDFFFERGIYIKVGPREALRLDGSGKTQICDNRDQVFVCQPQEITLTLRR